MLQKQKRGNSGPGATADSEQIKVASFFAGIGGFDLAFERENAVTVFQCEVDEYCRSVLVDRFPSLPLHGDIKTLDARSLPHADVWTGGFPCQDVSVARGWLGRDGLRGARSGLFYPLLDLIRERMPRAIVLENVTGLLSSHNGNDFGVVLDSLSELGYAVAWRVLNARYLGSPQSRPRVFIVATFDAPEIAVRALYDTAKSPKLESERKGFLEASRCDVTGAVVPRVAYCLAATSGRHTGTDWSRSYVSYTDRVRRLTPVECEGLQGFPAGWTVPTDNRYHNDDLDSLRYHALGNAVSVPTVQWIARNLLLALNDRRIGSLEANEIAANYQEFTTSVSVPSPELVHGNLAQSPWGSGGLCWKGSILMGKVSSAPATPNVVPFIDIVERSVPHDKYFLSPNAAQGILRRVRSQGRQLFPPLHDALCVLAGERA